MEKIIVVIDGQEMKMASVNFACYIAQATGSRLTGVFLENLALEEVPSMKIVHGMPYVETILAGDLPDHKQRCERIEQNKARFRETCEQRGVNCYIHSNKGIPEKEVILESRFADLIIVETETTFDEKSDAKPSYYLKKILTEAECPVIIAPPHHDDVEEILFAYDGSASSMFAIKQFTYLFPEFSTKKTIVLQVIEGNEDDVTLKNKIADYLKPHYASVGFKVLRGRTSDTLLAHLAQKKNTLLVMGAYGRNMLSNFLRRSRAELIIQTTNLPLFIAHQS
jgi:hypothetical protein